MKIALAGDHAGLSVKKKILDHLAATGNEFVDLGSF
jgi:ribose 5-phosphate isomerase RpiB